MEPSSMPTPRKTADLFWTLKGGGPNFEIVTRIDMYTVPVREIWYEIKVYSVDQIMEIIGK
jgi:hypothetical protein